MFVILFNGEVDVYIPLIRAARHLRLAPATP
jgi:hypothetical protein